MPQNKFWIYDSSGNRQEIQGAYVRDGSGNPFAISEIYMRDENGIPHKVFPTSDDPTNTTIMSDSWFTFCGIEGARVSPASFQSNSFPSVPTMPTQGQGLGNSIWHFGAYGYASDTWLPYGRFNWLSTPVNSSGDNPLDGLDWGFLGTVVRRVPNVTTTTVVPSQYVTRLSIRPSTIKHLSTTWDATNKAVWWSGSEDDFSSQFGNFRSLNVPQISADVDYYEYVSQGNKGISGPSASTTQPDCCFNTKEAQFSYNMRAWDGSSGYYETKLKWVNENYTYAFGPYTTQTPSIPVSKIDQDSQDTNSGKWVVLERYVAYDFSGNAVYCSSNSNDFPCNKSDAFTGFSQIEKEIVVAFVANRSASNTTYDFASLYNLAAVSANFYDNDAGNGSNRWHNWNGDGNVFLFMRYRTSAFSEYHQNSVGESPYFEPELKEFWVQPKAWSRVSGGNNWSSNYIGMVMTTLPTVYSDPCQPSGLNQAHKNLPKYFYWNIPLRQCSTGTITNEVVGHTYLPNTSNEWAWGTPTPFHTWDDNTGRQDLLGAGATTTLWDDVGFNPNASATSHPNSAENGYEFPLMQFNKDNSSMDGFPYGIGHAYGSDILAPAPWCACTQTSEGYNNDPTGPGQPRPPSGTVICPCFSEWSGGTLQVPNRSVKCFSPSAQPTQIYMLDNTQSDTPGIWDHTSWSSGVPSNIQWDHCEITGDGICGDECGDVDCFNCGEILDLGVETLTCNCAACCECIRFVDEFCRNEYWDGTCISYMYDESTCADVCVNNPDCPGTWGG